MRRAQAVLPFAILLAAVLAGCAQPSTPAQQAIDYLAGEVPDVDGDTAARIMRAVAVHEVDTTKWPSTTSPVKSMLGTPETYGETVRHLAALGQWLDSISLEAYEVQAVLSGHDGNQFGTNGSITDDALAVEALMLAGFPANDSLILGAVELLLDSQAPDGGWRHDGGTPGAADTTSWVIAALTAADGWTPQAREASIDFLVGAMHDGGYEYNGQVNCQSTALAITAWRNLQVTPPIRSTEYLASCQNPDGGFGYLPGGQSSVWVTTDALLALA